MNKENTRGMDKNRAKNMPKDAKETPEQNQGDMNAQDWSAEKRDEPMDEWNP